MWAQQVFTSVRRSAPAMLLAAALALAGCNRMVAIVTPSKGANNAVPAIQVKLHNRFAPNSLAATLDGQDITPGFGPKPHTPGTTITASMPNLAAGQHTLRVQGDFVTPQPFDFTSDQIQFSLPPLDLAPAPRLPTDPPDCPPGSTCGSPGQGPLGSITLKASSGVAVRLVVQTTVAGSSPVLVTLTPDNARILIDTQAPGAAAMVTIPSGARQVVFFVRGVQAGASGLTATSPGWARRALAVTVNP